MNWMLVSSVAEAVTATGLIGSLIYVGMEIRQATRVVHALSINVTLPTSISSESSSSPTANSLAFIPEAWQIPKA